MTLTSQQVPDHVALGDLGATLADAASAGGTSQARLLVALAHIAPSRCLEIMLACADRIRLACSRSDISSTVIAARNALTPRTGHHAAFCAIVRTFGDELSADAAVTCLQELNEPLDPLDRGAVDALLRRYPEHPGILREAIRIAQAAGDRGALDALLTRLTQADPSPATIASVYRTRKNLAPAQQADTKVALLSSFTIDGLVPFVDSACRSAGLVPAVYVSPFNSWTRDVLDESSELRRFAPDIAFLSVAIDDLLPELAGETAPDVLERGAATALDRVLHVVRRFGEAFSGKTLVVHSFHSAFNGERAASQSAMSRNEWLAELNVRLAAALRSEANTYFLDVEHTVATYGGSLRDNPKLRHLAAMRLPPTALWALSEAYLRYIAPLKGLRRKCVVLDLDNTLWGGVVGEDGAAGIRLGSTSPGSEFVEFQHYLRTLAASGVLLAINSKNNVADATSVLQHHEAMVLRESDFSAMRINWKPKPENMLEIAQELNIGLDSLVFVDDNPDERERMRQMLPEVLTVELPKDPALYRSVLERMPQLQTLGVTAEDRLRVDQYRTAKIRERSRIESSSVDEYLSSLELEVSITRVSGPLIPRVAQLFERTNQFNTTTRRYTKADVEDFAQRAQLRLWALRSQDKFGDHGLVAVALVDVSSPCWRIDSFLMSCRVIGYGIEDTLLAFITDRGRADAMTELVGEFIETKKNAPARDLYSRNGFALVETVDGVERWRHSLLTSLPTLPHWISLRTHDA